MVQANGAVCPRGHALEMFTARGPTQCCACQRVLFQGTPAMLCTACNWCVCGRCYKTLRIDRPQPRPHEPLPPTPRGRPATPRKMTPRTILTPRALTPRGSESPQVQAAAARPLLPRLPLEEAECYRLAALAEAEEAGEVQLQSAMPEPTEQELSEEIDNLKAKIEAAEAETPRILSKALDNVQGRLSSASSRWRVLGGVGRFSRAAADKVLNKTAGTDCARLAGKVTDAAEYIDTKVLAHHVRAYRREEDSDTGSTRSGLTFSRDLPDDEVAGSEGKPEPARE